MANKQIRVVESDTRTREDAVPLQSLEIPSSWAIRRSPSNEKKPGFIIRFNIVWIEEKTIENSQEYHIVDQS